MTVPAGTSRICAASWTGIALEVHQHQRRLLVRGQRVEGREDAVPPLAGQRPGLGVRLGRLRVPGAEQRPPGGVPLEVLGQRLGSPDLAAPEPVEAGVDHDPVQPGGHGRVAAERVGATVGRDQGVLERIGGVLPVAGGAQGDRPQPVAVPREQLAEGVGVAGEVGLEQGSVVAYVAWPRSGSRPSPGPVTT